MYSNHVIDSLKDGILLSDQEMSTKHKKFKKRALEYFYQHQMNESEINNSEILQHLNQVILLIKKSNCIIFYKIFNEL